MPQRRGALRWARAVLASVPEGSEEEIPVRAVTSSSSSSPPPPQPTAASAAAPSRAAPLPPVSRRAARPAEERGSRLSLIADLEQSEFLIPASRFAARPEVKSHFDWDSSSDEDEGWLARAKKTRKRKNTLHSSKSPLPDQQHNTPQPQLSASFESSPGVASPTSTLVGISPVNTRSSENSTGSGKKRSTSDEQQQRAISTDNTTVRQTSGSSDGLRLRTVRSLKNLKAALSPSTIPPSPSVASSQDDTTGAASPGLSPYTHRSVEDSAVTPPVPEIPAELKKKGRFQRYLSYSNLRGRPAAEEVAQGTLTSIPHDTPTTPKNASPLAKSASSPVLSRRAHFEQQGNSPRSPAPSSPQDSQIHKFTSLIRSTRSKDNLETAKADKKGKTPIYYPSFGLGITTETTPDADATSPVHASSEDHIKIGQHDKTSDADSVFSNISPKRIARAFGPDYDPHLSTFGMDAVEYLENLKEKKDTDKKKMNTQTAQEDAPHADSSSDAVLRAKRSSQDPSKVKVTPELRQQIEDARQSRERRLASLPTHPLLRQVDDAHDQPLSVEETDKLIGELTTMLARSKAAIKHNSGMTPPKASSITDDDEETQSADRAPPQVHNQMVSEQLDKLEDDINAVIEEWQACAPVTSPAAAENRLSDTQLLRQEYGLAPLRSARAGDAKHTKHNFEWGTEKVMCYMVHNPLDILPSLPSIEEGKEVNLATVEDMFFSKVGHTEHEPLRKCASDQCDIYCCHYGKLMASSKPRNSDVTEFSRAMQVRESARKLKARKPNGVEAWESFQKCMVCMKEYCPQCIALCAEQLCQQPCCSNCGTETSPYCGQHD